MFGVSGGDAAPALELWRRSRPGGAACTGLRHLPVARFGFVGGIPPVMP